ncbi:hypothetical protein Ocin01_07162 [Orchesella cincta]|uniref:FHA domain-containing protein n=1 Tax=Orchesella cincta TaxID=48709 RepID=A0A1D2N2N0_ORCCI|nr:hypothetical protein Ocin01_07162 [Orchesella cincta]
MLLSPTVEKRHAVLAFEPKSNGFTVRDLNTTNGTYLNHRRISADHPETVFNLDLLRFGYDIHFIQNCKKG